MKICPDCKNELEEREYEDLVDGDIVQGVNDICNHCKVVVYDAEEVNLSILEEDRDKIINFQKMMGTENNYAEPLALHAIDRAIAAENKISSLITTIESLQKENNYNNMLVESYRKQIDREQELIEEQNVQIESQKEEIEQLQRPALYLAYRVLRQKHEKDAELFVEHINGLEAQIESLKAITEIAVPALKYYADERNHKWTEKTKLAINTLSEIERLQNETN